MSTQPGPLTPPAYISGSVTISGAQIGVPQSLLVLIQAQLDPQCPGAAGEFSLLADSANSGANPVFVGGATRVAGDLSSTNYGYSLAPGASRLYRSFPLAASVLANIRVLCNSAATLHVEINP